MVHLMNSKSEVDWAKLDDRIIVKRSTVHFLAGPETINRQAMLGFRDGGLAIILSLLSPQDLLPRATKD